MSPIRLDDREYLRTQQYATSANLQARIGLHKRFKTNPYDWFLWVFDRLKLPEYALILEVGCGPGDLWLTNAHRVPPGWQVILSDLSPGMVAKARHNNPQIGFAGFCLADAQALPFKSTTFDAVIANHMLYHIPDLASALGSIQRLLKPGGYLYAATNGKTHLVEIDALVHRFDPSLDFPTQDYSFRLENGEVLLQQWFTQVSLERYEDGQLITEAEPLAAYICSMIGMNVRQEKRDQLSEFIAAEISQQGTIYVTKDVGLFIARKT